MKNLTLLCLLSFLSACVFHHKATQLPNVEARPETIACITPTLYPGQNAQMAVSIGDPVLEYTATLNSAEKVIAPGPRELRPLPTEGWLKTHDYAGSEVWTHPGYYGGDIGAVLDDSGVVTLYVQTGGAKKGRRWHAYRTEFFDTTVNTVDHWMLRYGGRQGSDYKFEIVDHPDQKANNITQDFVVSEREFLEGFMVRGVSIKGLQSGDHGLISYVVAGVPEKMKIKCEQPIEEAEEPPTKA